MKLSCLIVDDEPSAVSVLTKHIAKIPYLDLVFTTTNAAEANSYLSENRVAIVFSDIQMSETSGLDLLKLYAHQTHFVLTTGFREYALDGYEHGAIDYLVKPVTFERLLKAVQRIQNLYAFIQPPPEPSPVNNGEETTTADTLPSPYLFLKTEKGIVKIDIADICYVQAQDHYVKIQNQSRFILCYSSLREIEKKLPNEQFIKVSRSVIVALKQVSHIQHNEIVLTHPVSYRVKVGVTYKEKLLQLITSLQ